MLRKARLIRNRHAANAKRPIPAIRRSEPTSIGRRECVLADDFYQLLADVPDSRCKVIAQAARVIEAGFTVAAARLGIDFSMRRISSAKMPDVAV